jgi:CRP/FNR family transcriptional regulator, anaerobic regulatory protein
MQCDALDDHGLCRPCALARIDSPAAASGARRRLRRGEALYRQGDPLRRIYAVVAGSLKSVMATDADDGEQVVGFHISGEILGLDGLALRQHESTAIALEDSEVIAIPCDGSAARVGGGALADAAAHLLSREVVRERRHMIVLNRKSAVERLAAFLLDVSRRMHARGYSGTDFHLRMSREEIGGYLQLNLETVSRAFSKLREQGLVAVDGKHVRLLDLPRLEQAG